MLAFFLLLLSAALIFKMITYNCNQDTQIRFFKGCSLINALTKVDWTFNTFENNFAIEQKFTKYL